MSAPLAADLERFRARPEDAQAFDALEERLFVAGQWPSLVELYEAYTTEDASDFALERLAPATFVGAAGFRFEFALTRRMDSLPLRGLGYGAVVDGRLYLAIYSAPRQHYFEAHVAAAEAAVRSARLTCPRSAACASP